MKDVKILVKKTAIMSMDAFNSVNIYVILSC